MRDRGEWRRKFLEQGSKRNSGDMVRREGGSGGSNLEKGRNPLALSRGGC